MPVRALLQYGKHPEIAPIQKALTLKNVAGPHLPLILGITEKSGSILLTLTLKIFISIYRFPSQASLLQAKQGQLPQPYKRGLVPFFFFFCQKSGSMDHIFPFQICMKIKLNLILHMPCKLHFILCFIVSHTGKKWKMVKGLACEVLQLIYWITYFLCILIIPQLYILAVLWGYSEAQALVQEEVYIHRETYEPLELYSLIRGWKIVRTGWKAKTVAEQI